MKTLHDPDTMAAQYDQNAVLLPPGAPAAHGQSAIRAFFANMMPAATKDGLAFTQVAVFSRHVEFGRSVGARRGCPTTWEVVPSPVSREATGKDG